MKASCWRQAASAAPFVESSRGRSADADLGTVGVVPASRTGGTEWVEACRQGTALPKGVTARTGNLVRVPSLK